MKKNISRAPPNNTFIAHSTFRPSLIKSSSNTIQMFWGIVIKPGASVTLSEGSELIHVSQACLAEAKEGKCQLQVTDHNVTYTIAILEKEKNEMTSLDLFFNTVTPPTFINKGKSEIHLSGYFEMSNEPESEDEFDDEEIESEIDEEEEEVVNAAAAKAAIAGLSKKKAAAQVEESEDDEEGLIEGSDDDEDMEEDDDEEDDEEDDDEEEDDEEDDGEDDEEDDDEEEDEEDDEEEEEEEQPKSKRAAPTQAKNQPPAKNQKTEASPEDFAKAVVAFLKTKGGKSNISNIGGSVKRPAEVPKLKQFLAARKEFKLNGDNVELA